MPQNVTLAYVLDRIWERYGRQKASVKARLVGDLNEWINRACRRFNFWFLHQDPGMAVVQSFPLTASDFSELTPQRGQWVDKGWLLTLADTPSYMYAYPTIEKVDYLNADDPPVTEQGWAWGEITNLLYVKEFDYLGCFLRDLPILPYSEFMSFMKFDQKTRPDRASFQTANGVSILHLAPTPDTGYLYQVRTKLAQLPPLDRADSTNVFLQTYPELVITAGLLIAADYFHELQEIQLYSMRLYGGEYAQTQDPTKVTPGGLLGEALADTRRRNKSESDQLRVYTSSHRALGRDNGRVRSRYPWNSYYGPL